MIGAVAWKTYASCPCQDAVLCLRSSEIWQVRSGRGLGQSRAPPFPGFLRSDRAAGEDSSLLSPLHLVSVLFFSLLEVFPFLSPPLWLCPKTPAPEPNSPTLWGSVLKHLLLSRIHQPSLGLSCHFFYLGKDPRKTERGEGKGTRLLSPSPRP